jgi:hypothetical protein
MPEGQTKFLIEIKNKKVVVYRVELSLPSKNIAQEWGKKWITVNKRNVDDHKVVVTEIVG